MKRLWPILLLFYSADNLLSSLVNSGSAPIFFDVTEDVLDTFMVAMKLNAHFS